MGGGDSCSSGGRSRKLIDAKECMKKERGEDGSSDKQQTG